MAKRAIRPIRIEGNLAYVPLTRGYEAIIDVADAPLVAAWNWWAKVCPHTVYAVRKNCSGGKQRSVFFHRIIMAAPEGMDVDHISGDGLDNRRANLRIATRSQNHCNRRITRQNTSGHKGVFWHKQRGKWQAQIQINGKRHSLGLFATREAAGTAYAEASARLHGEFGRAA